MRAAFWPAGSALHRLLFALGDLPADAPPPTEREPDPDNTTLAEAVRRFQHRHGLAADGVIGRATLAALKVPLKHRVQQLALALKRLRWLSDLGAQPVIAINIPMFRLWAWDAAAPADAFISMGVVVGRALNTQTPVLTEAMRCLNFRPCWNMPRSIVRNDVLNARGQRPHAPSPKQRSSRRCPSASAVPHHAACAPPPRQPAHARVGLKVASRSPAGPCRCARAGPAGRCGNGSAR